MVRPGRLRVKSKEIDYKSVLKEKDELLNKLESDNRILSQKFNESQDIIQELEGRVSELELELEEAEADIRNLQEQVEEFENGKDYE